jgi:hypothetical protein
MASKPTTLRRFTKFASFLKELDNASIPQQYEALHPETKHGRNSGGPSAQFAQTGVESFSQNTAAATGKHRATVDRAAARGEALGEVAKAVVGIHPAGSSPLTCEVVRNVVEGRFQLVADTAEGGNRSDGDQGGDQAVFDSRGAVFVMNKVLEKLHRFALHCAEPAGSMATAQWFVRDYEKVILLNKKHGDHLFVSSRTSKRTCMMNSM